MVEVAYLLAGLAEFIQLTVIGIINHFCVVASALTQLVLAEPGGKVTYYLAALLADKLISHYLFI